jgi:hypothetical protein
VLQSDYMNDVVSITIKTELDEIKSEVRSLKDMVMELVRENRRLLGRLRKEELDTSDVTPDELMYYAAHGFNVTSEYTEDDDNVADPTNIKPVDWSKYA